MTDRREAVARAIYEKVALWVEDDPEQTVPWESLDDACKDWNREMADAALAVIDAEPTEAEVEAAVDAFWLASGDFRAMLRAALIAARKAGKE